MSYVDRNSGGDNARRNKALTGGVVALIQGGLALALVNGLAVNFFPPDKPRHLPTHLYPTQPIPPELVESAELPQQPATQQAQPRVPERRLALDPDPVFTGVVVDPVLPTGGVEGGQDLVIEPVLPSDPPARFAPRAARPRGDAARWVTTEDYPTADIRAGHTGTVRFRLSIDASGRVSGCTVTQSSGFPGLDAATCRNVAKRARFDAASDATGEKVGGTYEGTIRWVIPND
ncbi:TonB family protein [Novosphingobium soli]|uniref:TonB family protein n=1 Tax=Novosphingobium soli TaxID=574956 RepID=A0ABV6D014_9SPHN